MQFQGKGRQSLKGQLRREMQDQREQKPAKEYQLQHRTEVTGVDIVKRYGEARSPQNWSWVKMDDHHLGLFDVKRARKTLSRSRVQKLGLLTTPNPFLNASMLALLPLLPVPPKPSGLVPQTDQNTQHTRQKNGKPPNPRSRQAASSSTGPHHHACQPRDKLQHLPRSARVSPLLYASLLIRSAGRLGTINIQWYARADERAVDIAP